MDGDDVHVWRIDLKQTESNTRSLARLLNEDETSRAGRFYFPKHRDRFIVARGVLRLILGRYLEADPAQLRFSYSPYGKPSLRGKYSASELQFNLAHSHEAAVYAFTLRRQIGIDIEYMRADTSGDEIAERFFAATEVAALLALPPEQRTAAFFNCWTRKEAYIKARGEGLSFPLGDFAVSLAPGEPAALLSVVGAPQETSRWSLRELTPGVGYVAAIAVEGHQWRLKHWEGKTLITTLE
jgi:4'-phosphopantetheinyl transferase